MSKEVMRQALEALEAERDNYQDWDEKDGAPEYIHEAITALREALAEQPAVQQEPVAYWIPKAEQFCIADPSGRPFAKAWEPLYTYPPAQQEAQAEETVKERTPQERRDAGEWHCLECFTFGHQHRRGCTAAHGIKEKNT